MAKAARQPVATFSDEPKKKGHFHAFLGIVVESLGWALTFLLVAFLGVVVVIPLLQGARPTTVTTNSMYPVIKPGDLVMIGPAQLDNLKIGDVAQVQPKSGDSLTYVHRVEGITLGKNNARVITTKGVNNNSPDAPVTHAEQIHGKITTWPFTNNLYIVPKLGYAKANPVPTLIVAGTLVLLGVGTLFGKSRREKRREAEAKAAEERKRQEELDELKALRDELKAQRQAAPQSEAVELRADELPTSQDEHPGDASQGDKPYL